MRRALLMTLLGAAFFAVPQARADLAQLKASCQAKAVDDAPAYGYRLCDDGVPATGGATVNPGADRAIAVPAAYAGVDGLPPADAAAAAAVPGNDNGTVALDVNLWLPDPARVPPPAAGYPLIVLMHGCCGGSKSAWERTLFAAEREHWHYNSAWFAARGYVVVTYTSRGFVDGNGHGSTGETHVQSLRYELNDFQHLVGQIADDPALHVDPRRIVASGGSYGGGFSWLALTDPIWTSPGGRPMRLAAVATKYGWTDVLYALTPTGRHFYDEGPLPATDGSDSGFTPPGGTAQKVGLPIRSILAGLYASGETGLPGIPPGNPHTTFPQYVRDAIACTVATYPPEGNPLCDSAFANFIPDSIAHRSAYLRNGFFERVRTDPAYRIPVFSSGTFTDPLFPPAEHRRMAERLKAAAPGYPIRETYGDYQHFSQNKAKEWADLCGSDRHLCVSADYPGGNVDAVPANRVRTGITTELNRFVDHSPLPAGAGPPPPTPAQDVTATLQVCPQNAGPGQPADEPGDSFTAPTFDELTPGEMALEFTGSQSTLSEVTPNSHANAADPVVNQVGNGARCPVATDTAEAGVATFESPPLTSSATMLGGGILTVDYAASGDLESLQLNARLYDLYEDGTAVMVDRGPRRIDPRRDGTTQVTFQLHGNGWRFPAGHRIRLELAQDDDPYLHASTPFSSMVISRAKLVLPVRETTFGRDDQQSRQPADRTAPVVRIVRARVRGRRLTVGWRGSDIGSGIRSYRVELRTGRRGRWRVIARATRRTSVTLRIRSGRRYAVRVRAVDRAGNRSRYAQRTIRTKPRAR